MTERIPKIVLVSGVVLAPFALALFAYARPWYFTNQTYIGGILVLELLCVAIWMYRRFFFPLVIVSFLFAGANLPVGLEWTTLRWVFLFVGALVGCIVMLKYRNVRFGLFHAFASFAVLAAMVSAAVSRYPGFAFLKALSLLLLFVYAGTGARIAVAGRENRFFSGLVISCEVLIAGIAACRFVGIEAMGNPNSLGAVVGVVGAPILLWGTLVSESSGIYYRRLALFALCTYLIFHSHARAAMAASFVSCGLLCLASRKYKLFAGGLSLILVIVAALGILQPEAFSNGVSTATSSFVFKSKDPRLGLFSSRQEPWQAALDTISAHFWFGTGFGTTDNGHDASEHLSMFESNPGVTAENGSSYLAILTWVGVLGAMPFFLTVFAILSKAVRTVAWMWKTGNPCHPAVPLAMVIIAGLIHAGLEDWLFAPGYYLCVFFWCAAFVLADVAPLAALPQFAAAWRPRAIPWSWGGASPTQ